MIQWKQKSSFSLTLLTTIKGYDYILKLFICHMVFSTHDKMSISLAVTIRLHAGGPRIKLRNNQPYIHTTKELLSSWWGSLKEEINLNLLKKTCFGFFSLIDVYEQMTCYDLHFITLKLIFAMAGSLNTSDEYNYQNAFRNLVCCMLIGAIAFPFVWGIQFLHENEKPAKYSGNCIQLT